MLKQVNRFLNKRSYQIRYCHNDQTGKLLYRLSNRKLLKVSGNEASAFLQGLITNDMRHLEDGVKSMYAMFLNNKGRVLYDSLVHKGKEDDAYMIECDTQSIALLHKHLNLYKLKRKVIIENVSEQYNVWALISNQNAIDMDGNNIAIEAYKDPRLSDLGHRILTPSTLAEDYIIDNVGTDVAISNDIDDYKRLRYKLGISEGADDLPQGTCFPLEANCDYLHGVSFHKGCYIGQELTARVHHTGVVRKRIMPIKFTEEVKNLELDTIISASNNPKSNLGKLKGYIGHYGIGLVRVKEALESKELRIGNYSVEIQKPFWWPKEAPKEKATLNRQEL